MSKQDNLEQKLMHRVLKEAVFDGWNAKTLYAAGKKLGLTRQQVKRLYPEGPRQVMIAYARYLDDRMAEIAVSEKIESMKIRDRIFRLVEIRLDLMQPHREALRRAIAARIMRFDGLTSTQEVASSVDLMWRLAADQSTDFNWYTKRFLLAGVYGSTVLYWLNDASENAADSKDFLRRRIENILIVQKLRGKIEARLEKAPNPFALMSKLRS